MASLGVQPNQQCSEHDQAHIGGNTAGEFSGGPLIPPNEIPEIGHQCADRCTRDQL